MLAHVSNLIASLCFSVLADITRLTPTALAQVGRASLQGGTLIATIWLACRLLPKLPAAARHVLWTLACLKLVVTLFWAAPIAVQVLSPEPLPPTIAALPALAKSHFVAPVIDAPPEVYGPPAQGSTPMAIPAMVAVAKSTPNPKINSGSAIFIAYVAILFALLAATIVRGVRLRRLVREARSVTHAIDIALIAACASKAGLRRVPAVRVSDAIPGPLVCGLMTPTLLLPTGWMASQSGTDTAGRVASPGAEVPGYKSKDYPPGAPNLGCAVDPTACAGNSPSALGQGGRRPGRAWQALNLGCPVAPTDLELALAHEMAHIRRGDLLTSVVPAAARLLFWFHPLAYLAEAEFRSATEEACDARAMRVTGAQPGDYFRLLLSVAEASALRCGQAVAGTMGLSVGFKQLRRRLDSLANVCGKPVSVSLRIAAVLLTGACVFVMAPFRFTAHARALIESTLPTYGLVDLGTTPDRGSAANGISNDGTVVGELLPSITRGPGHALLWRNGSAVPIDPLPTYRHSDAAGINNAGMVIASAYNYGNFHHAFIWSGGSQTLGSLPGYRFSKACAINDAGQVVGSAQAGRPRFGQTYTRAFLWQAGQMRDLGTLGGTYSCAYGIDDKGEVVGKADTARPLLGTAVTHAFAWKSGALTDLGTLGGPNSVAYAANDAGVVAGAADIDVAARHACLWYHGQVSDLGALAPGAVSQARAINRRGQAVGSSTLGPDSPDTHAILWQSGRLIDLNSLLPPGSPWTLEDARGINNHGQIVGMGRVNGRKHAYVLTPTAAAPAHAMRVGMR